MKTIKLVTVLACLSAMALTGPATVLAQEDDMRFHPGEFDISPFGVYADQAGGKWGAGASATYFVTQRFGLGAATYWTDLGGTVFDNVEFEGYYRIPLFKVVAPYGVASVGYQFDREYWFETLGLGVDFRAFKNLTAFSDVQYRIANSDLKNGALIRLGVRFTF